MTDEESVELSVAWPTTKAKAYVLAGRSLLQLGAALLSLAFTRKA